LGEEANQISLGSSEPVWEQTYQDLFERNETDLLRKLDTALRDVDDRLSQVRRNGTDSDELFLPAEVFSILFEQSQPVPLEGFLVSEQSITP
jgi:hypothetical protein